MADLAQLQAKLKVLGDAYAAQLPEKIKQVVLAWGQIPQTEWDEEGFRAMHRLVHGMTGSGKTFGYSALSEAARKLEDYLKLAAETKQVLNKEQRDDVKRLLGELSRSATQRDNLFAAESQMIAVAPASQSAHAVRQVFVVEDDHALAGELQAQLSYFGYEVKVFYSLSEFRKAMPENPDIVVMDISFPGQSRGGLQTMAELQQGREAPIPVIFMTSYNELDVRLEAVRAGGLAFLTKPLNFGVLLDQLDELTSSQTPAAYRVLIVDDSIQLANYYATALEQAGMLVKVVNDPLKVLDPLLEFAPDLILIDMYMPGCDGMELAKVIRQINEFVSIPIVFLSAESNLEKQLDAIGLGGDDFLTKPIEGQHLVSSVSSRIKRSLLLRSFMVRDSLTGLLNHTAIKAQLSNELARAKRQGKSLTFAMVDIDHFKKVNDTYGHPVGDGVIKSLSRLLKQRLRENDLVGRYGGEEFAVVLVDADAVTAMTIMDTIRKDFAQLLHMADDREFTVTISCGVADNAHYAEASTLADAADKALYKAKHAGRNQVMPAG